MQPNVTERPLARQHCCSPSAPIRAWTRVADAKKLTTVHAARDFYATTISHVRLLALAFRDDPSLLAKLALDVQGAAELPSEALPALDDALCAANIEGAEAAQATALYHRHEDVGSLRRMFKEEREALGARIIAIEAMEAELERRKEHA